MQLFMWTLTAVRPTLTTETKDDCLIRDDVGQ